MRTQPISDSSLPMISVITVALNAASTIGTTLQSVAGQQVSLSQIEHIVVDGLSTDNTLEIVRDYPHVRYISEKDQGVSDAFNKGLHLARGQYVLCLNADDVLHDVSVLRDVMEFAQLHQFPEWIVGEIEVRNLHGDIQAQHRSYPPTCWSLIFRNRIAHPATFVKRMLLLEMSGFDLNYRLAMDYDLWARLCLAGYDFAYYNRLIAIFALGGLTTTQQSIGKDEGAKVRQRLRNTPLKRLAGVLYDRLKGN